MGKGKGKGKLGKPSGTSGKRVSDGEREIYLHVYKAAGTKYEDKIIKTTVKRREPEQNHMSAAQGPAS